MPWLERQRKAFRLQHLHSGRKIRTAVICYSCWLTAIVFLFSDKEAGGPVSTVQQQAAVIWSGVYQKELPSGPRIDACVVWTNKEHPENHQQYLHCNVLLFEYYIHMWILWDDRQLATHWQFLTVRGGGCKLAASTNHCLGYYYTAWIVQWPGQDERILSKNVSSSYLVPIMLRGFKLI